MTNESGFPSSNESWSAEQLLARPRAVTAASVLWICLGVLLALDTNRQLMLDTNWQLVDLRTAAVNSISVLLEMGAGAAFIVLASFLLRGSNRAGTALIVLGASLLLFCWPALFVVPAIVLQFRPRSSAWFNAVNAPSANAPTPRSPNAGAPCNTSPSTPTASATSPAPPSPPPT